MTPPLLAAATATTSSWVRIPQLLGNLTVVDFQCQWVKEHKASNFLHTFGGHLRRPLTWDLYWGPGTVLLRHTISLFTFYFLIGESFKQIPYDKLL